MACSTTNDLWLGNRFRLIIVRDGRRLCSVHGSSGLGLSPAAIVFDGKSGEAFVARTSCQVEVFSADGQEKPSLDGVRLAFGQHCD